MSNLYSPNIPLLESIETPQSFNFLQEMNDSLSELPDDLLNKISSMLDMKVVVQTGILSKRWRYICSNRFESLTSVKLECVNIRDFDLVKMMERCPLLEELALDTCPQLTKLIIPDSNNTRLKILSLHKCSNLREIVLCAKNLHTLEYTGMPGWFSLISTSRLVNVFTSETRHGLYPLTRLCHDIPTLENLVISSEASSKFFKYSYPLPTFSNLRRLVLPVSPFSDDDKLLCISYILQAFPLLQTLELNLCSSRWQPIEIWKGVLENFPNRSITKLVLNGFAGKHNEVYLLRYLLENLKGLRILAIGPSGKVYSSFNCWVNQEASIFGTEWFEDHWKWVRTIVSPSVLIEFLEGPSPHDERFEL